MNVVILGLMFSDLSLKAAYEDSKCGVQMATHTFQENLVKGMEQVVNVSVVNVPPIGSFPINYKKIYIKSRNWGTNNHEVGYINLPVIKHFFQEKAIYSNLKQRLIPGDKNVLLVYSLYKPFLQIVNRLKSEQPDLHVCLIQTDAIAGRNGMGKYMTKHSIKEGNELVALAKKCDSFVILTKYIAEPLEIGNRPYIVLECICDENQPENETKDESENICLYTGALEKAYGICDMVDAFKSIPDAQLWICGAGDAEEYIKEAAKEYSNIKFYGFVNKQRVMELRNQCDFLINPRRPEGTYTLYSFPSKTAEYLMSGKPVIMYKLEGIPDDYDPYINYLTGENYADICEELKRIFSSDYKRMKAVALRSREYMLSNKNKSVQAAKILELINNR